MASEPWVWIEATRPTERSRSAGGGPNEGRERARRDPGEVPEQAAVIEEVRPQPLGDGDLPRSTLLMLVAAFAGYEHTMAVYREAIAREYRLYSYGDAMAVL